MIIINCCFFATIDNAGAAFLYVKTGSSWSLQQAIAPGYSGSNFGYSVAISSSDGTIAIGASGSSKYIR